MTPCYYPLDFAVIKKNEKMVELLLKHGADPCLNNGYALKYSKMNNNTKIVDLLMKKIINSN